MLKDKTSVAYMATLYEMLCDGWGISQGSYDKLDMDYLQKEYELIKQKKSTLSAFERKTIVRIMEKHEPKPN